MTLTVYEKQLIKFLDTAFPGENAGAVTERLIRMGVVDTVRCKVLVVREFVYDLVRSGSGKVAAMSIAADKFCCSYEYVRKCMYYYKDVNFAVSEAVAGPRPSARCVQSRPAEQIG